MAARGCWIALFLLEMRQCPRTGVAFVRFLPATRAHGTLDLFSKMAIGPQIVSAHHHVQSN
jgi:hypothetical protein